MMIDCAHRFHSFEGLFLKAYSKVTSDGITVPKLVLIVAQSFTEFIIQPFVCFHTARPCNHFHSLALELLDVFAFVSFHSRKTNPSLTILLMELFMGGQHS